jgi:glucosamine-6-phosphate deaminase
MDAFAKDDIGVDLSLLLREPLNEEEVKRQNILRKVQKYCDDYEDALSQLGGIGFFLGGIGPDGHIAFNQEGSAHDSKTRYFSYQDP